jgi:hypothetical protein
MTIATVEQFSAKPDAATFHKSAAIYPANGSDAVPVYGAWFTSEICTRRMPLSSHAFAPLEARACV